MASYDVQLIEVESDRVCVSLNQQKGWMELGPIVVAIEVIGATTKKKVRVIL